MPDDFRMEYLRALERVWNAAALIAAYESFESLMGELGADLDTALADLERWVIDHA